MSYKQFTEKDIYSIEIYKKEWLNHSKIALKLNKNHTNIDRIVKKYKSPKTWIFYARYCIKMKKQIRSKVNRENKNRIKEMKQQVRAERELKKVQTTNLKRKYILKAEKRVKKARYTVDE